MDTLEKLQAKLNSEVISLLGIFESKPLCKPVVCMNGVTLSVQASEYHYCEPRDNVGPYTEVEVWQVKGTDDITQFDYSADDPSAYVPIEQVVAFIDAQGGMAY